MSNHHPQLKLVITPRRPALVAGADNVVDVLVRLQAPERPAGYEGRKRADLNIALVLDRSGSMRGRPLDEARNAARFVIDRLGAQDRCALVMYDTVAEVLMQATPVQHREPFHAAINRITDGGSTDLHQGWLRGAEALAPLVTATAISRVILLSDGMANAGLTDTATICKQVERLASAGVTTTTLGLGHSFNEDLMTQIARAGAGRSYYGEEAEDLMAPFREEFDLLNDLAARQIGCVLKVAQGIKLEVLNQLGKETNGRLRMPDVAWNSEAMLALRLTVPAHLLANETMCELISASASCTDAEGNTFALGSDPLVLKIMGTTAYSALAEDETVATRFNELKAASIQDRARKAAERDDWDAVDKCLDELTVLAKDNPWIEAMLKHIRKLALQRDEARLRKEAMFSSDSLHHRLSEVNESRSLTGEDSKAIYLARKLRHGKGRPTN